jgi:hypothetical protein
MLHDGYLDSVKE